MIQSNKKAMSLLDNAVDNVERQKVKDSTQVAKEY
eukprot:CAMPEP_0116884132 /NCGR_PEP_ID=MMETSP0463-20121206/16886_1 /TAXON_ID=181622 /ORGANISM="Strombidinopsis sp, Strain SopsisLIS2011" /LENGTH=34 /DNA_ID= /DNA_START= /DNA_END= /DNA_ORIENTATION=